jgi:hypothetical protein
VRSFFHSVASPPGTAGRPRSLVAAAALVGLQGLVLVAVGLVFMGAGLLGEPAHVLDAELIGGMSVLGGGGLLAVGRALGARRAWARSPALVWQLILVGVGATQLTENPTIAVPFLVVGALTVAALFHPETGAVLED